VQIGVLRTGRNIGTVAEGAKTDDVASVTIRTFNAVATPAVHNQHLSPDDHDYNAADDGSLSLTASIQSVPKPA
jgi:hypothetical protein